MVLPLTNAAVIFMLIHACASNGCTTGWFGEKCQYKCQCTEDKCDVNGSCTDNVKCKRGWFGPLCQYQNLLELNNVTIPDTCVNSSAENDKIECLNNRTSSPLKIELQGRYFLSWIRLIVKEKAMSTFDATNIIFNRNETDTTNNKCHNPKIYRQPKKNIIDVVCDLEDTFSSVIIVGDMVRDISAIQISGGRNVALHQFAQQSTNYTKINVIEGLNFSQASNAVDGYTGLFTKETCSHTADGDRSPNWTLTLAHPQVVHRYILYNRRGLERRLRKFQLQSSTSDRKVIFKYTGPDEAKPSYLITTVPRDEPITYIQVFGGDYTETESYLTLCEVEAFGDSSCSCNKFGLDCNRSCNCEDRKEKCFVATGSCVSGCASGFHGEACSDECPFNKWGIDCLQSCNSQCPNNTCHPVTGSCKLSCYPWCYELDCSQSMFTDGLLKGIGIGVGGSIGLVIFIASAVLIFRVHKVRQRKSLEDYHHPSGTQHSDHPYELPVSERSAPANVKREERIYGNIKS